ncbi:hypothetical protein C475_09214 [Halosimplex carlsbadense 2-9-1]|uniref:Uncharacterized protein n=1 Tax=Halosimplex carlsbadense 2-9-1 TaxID=797114 RepID=M0CQX6_9EURY|nr:hypothetical protein [Halosimplex carlsbadense]ELZ25626.1 hypothetical protein C475_09214 [Halosimplex carlsbadense 2-9-1]
MPSLSPLARPGLLLAASCGAVGAAVQSPERAVLWALVGYFLGKSIQSTVWAVTAGPSA